MAVCEHNPIMAALELEVAPEWVTVIRDDGVHEATNVRTLVVVQADNLHDVLSFIREENAA